jgi:hypothetical protein
VEMSNEMYSSVMKTSVPEPPLPVEELPEAPESERPLEDGPASLDRLAQEINARLDKADAMEGKAIDHRIAAGLRLKQARELVPRGQWGEWLAANIKRSRQDVYRCLALAKSDDPAEQRQARERERMQVREQVRRSRAIPVVSYVCDNPQPSAAEPALDGLDEIKRSAATVSDPVEVIKALILGLDTAGHARCKAWCITHFELSAAPPTNVPARQPSHTIPQSKLDDATTDPSKQETIRRLDKIVQGLPQPHRGNLIAHHNQLGSTRADKLAACFQ